MRKFIRILLIVLPMVLVWFAGQAYAAKRVALVIGNSSYERIGKLANPINDAVLLGGKLTNLGFDVLLHTDLKFNEFSDVLRQFETELEGAEAALFFYAGHGMQFRKENYLLATDANLRDEHDVSTSGRDLKSIIEIMERKVPLSLVFVDACRDNPMANQLVDRLGSKSRSLGIGRGLAPVEHTANTLIAFATKPGAIAADGDGKNSPFTASLAQHIETANIEVSTMLKRVTRDVLERTEHKQRPEVVASMDSEFYFFQNEIAPQATVTYDSDAQKELLATKALQNAMVINSPISFQAVIDAFPGTNASDIADQLLKQKLDTLAKQQKKATSSNQQVAISAADLLKKLDAAQSSDTVTEVVSLTPEDVETSLGLDKDGFKKIQNALNMLGFDAGVADGVFGGKSRKALKSFQVANRIEQTGFIDNASLLHLIKVFEETPKTYDGLWNLEVHRFNPHPEDPAHINMRTLLSSAQMRIRGSEINIVNWQNQAGDSRGDNRNPFAKFSGNLASNGRFTMRFDADYLFSKKRIKNVQIKGTLPQFVAYDAQLEYRGARLEYVGPKDEMWVRIELKRIDNDG